MKVYVQTTKEVSCLLNADKIEIWKKNYLKVIDKNGNIMGLFDLGCVNFVYMTEPGGK
jgi:hypothetical protein